MVSAKQRAARAKFSRIMKSGGFKKHRSAKRQTKTVYKTVVRRVNMARGRRGRRFTRRGIRGSLGGARSIFKDVSAGVGGGIVAAEIANRVFPQAAPIAKLGGAYIAGGVKGIVGTIAFDAITGQGGVLSGIFGGGQSGGDSL